uniref:Uncharacterized protein n=1 Tax=Anguilla anguilla TaxID=7936 RepID=A0A0E9XHM9_ANGAN
MCTGRREREREETKQANMGVSQVYLSRSVSQVYLSRSVSQVVYLSRSVSQVVYLRGSVSVGSCDLQIYSCLSRSSKQVASKKVFYFIFVFCFVCVCVCMCVR